MNEREPSYRRKPGGVEGEKDWGGGWAANIDQKKKTENDFQRSGQKRGVHRVRLFQPLCGKRKETINLEGCALQEEEGFQGDWSLDRE